MAMWQLQLPRPPGSAAMTDAHPADSTSDAFDAFEQASRRLSDRHRGH